MYRFLLVVLTVSQYLYNSLKTRSIILSILFILLKIAFGGERDVMTDVKVINLVAKCDSRSGVPKALVVGEQKMIKNKTETCGWHLSQSHSFLS